MLENVKKISEFKSNQLSKLKIKKINLNEENESILITNFKNCDNFKNLNNINTINENSNFNKENGTFLTKEYFIKKTETNFIKNLLNPISKKNSALHKNRNETCLSILKTDIIQIDESLKNHSDILRYYLDLSTSNLNSHFHYKLNEVSIESKIEINNFFENIETNCKNLEYLLKEFKSKTKDELIYKLSIELFHHRLFINKLNNFVFLLNLTNHDKNKEFSENYKDTFSKFEQVKFLIQKMQEKFSQFELENSSFINSSCSYFCKDSLNFNGITGGNPDSDFPKILEFNSLTEIFRYETNDVVINHIKFLFTNFCDKSFNIFADLVLHLLHNFNLKIENESENFMNKLSLNSNLHHKNLNLKSRKVEDTIESFILIRKYIEDFVGEKEKIFEELKFKLENLRIENHKLNDKISRMESESRHSSEEKKLKNFEIFFLKIQEENNILYQNVKDLIETKKIKIDESRRVNIELEAMKYKNQTLATEMSYLEKQIVLLKENIKKPQEIEESYEKILQEQYTTMKNSFTDKLNSLTEEFSKYQLNTIKTIATLEEELKIFKKTRDLLVNQTIDIKKKFNASNI